MMSTPSIMQCKTLRILRIKYTKPVKNRLRMTSGHLSAPVDEYLTRNYGFIRRQLAYAVSRRQMSLVGSCGLLMIYRHAKLSGAVRCGFD